MSSTSTSTTTLEQRYAVPATVTAGYVNDVLVALNRVYGDVVRKQVTSGRFEPADLVPLRAIFSENETFQAGYALTHSDPKPADVYHAPIGDRRMSVIRLLTVRADCISLEALYDFSAVVRNPPAPSSGWISLRPKEPAADPGHVNPTPWMIATEEFRVEDKCLD